MSCETNILIIAWDSSPVAGATYFLVSEKWGGATTTVATADTSYPIFTMQCGEHYTFRVIARDSTCNSSLSQPLEKDTGTNVDNLTLSALSIAHQVLQCNVEVPHTIPT